MQVLMPTGSPEALGKQKGLAQQYETTGEGSHSGLVTLSVSAQVQGSHMVVGAEGLHLMPPADPGLWKPVQHEHQWLAGLLPH